jgi:ribosomal protein S18 acetylase RimI-like enzyme
MSAVTDDLLARLERYYDAVPRRFARVEECGPFTLFLGEPGGWVYYARPRLGGDGPFDAPAVSAALARLREHGLPEVVEWVHETTPGLLDAVRAEASLQVEEIPLMVLDGEPGRVALPAGVTVRLLTARDGDALAAASAVSGVAFAAPGTARGEQGPAERDAETRPSRQRVLDLLAEGAVRVAVAEAERDGVVATGRVMPVDGVAEIVGVATLPSARRQGLGAAVTAALVDDARSAGVSTVFLTASSEAVARVYARIGFRRVGTGYAAEGPHS